jgi:hypothetical protein
MMKYIVPITALLLSYACNEPQPATTTAPILKADTIVNVLHTVYVTQNTTHFPTYIIHLKTRYLLPDSLKQDSSYYAHEHLLYIFNKKTQHIDSLVLDIFSTAYDVTIQDVSDSLHFTPLLLSIEWKGDSDMPCVAFIQYNTTSFSTLFSIEAPVISLRRKDEWTLNGMIMNRESELPASCTYPFTISLKDYDLRIERPDTQIIGFPTIAENDIKANKVIDNHPIHTIIKAGTTLTIDTLYRTAGLIRFTIADSIAVYAKPGDILPNIKQDDAG